MPESIDPNDFLKEKGIYASSAVSLTVRDEIVKKRLEHELTIKNLAGLIIVIGMVICGVVLLFNPNSSQSQERQEQRTWAQSTLTLIIGGALGLLAGKGTSSGS